MTTAWTPVLCLLAPAPGEPAQGLWGLFTQSFDAFTVLLLAGSLVGMTSAFMCLLEVRAKNIVPPAVIARLRDLVSSGRWEDLALTLRDDDSFVSRVLRPAAALMGTSRTAIRDAAEIAAGEESARWFRRVDMLSLIGNLGPLVGLAGTVWGMILAFTSLGNTHGQAGPADLSLGISKALFHTLLGLCLAIPCLLAYGIFRAKVDRLCTRGMAVASEIVERLPAQN